MALRTISDLVATAVSYFRIGLTSSGVRLKAVAGALRIRSNSDSADANLIAAKLSASGNDIELNEDAAGSGADWLYTLRRPSSGMSAAVIITLPPTDGSPAQVLTTDGSGNTTWETPGTGNPNGELIDETALAFGDSSPVAMFTKPVDSAITKVQVIVTTPFNGTAPTLSIGIVGTTSKYAATTEIDLKTAGIYEITPDVGVVAGTEALIATYSADSSAAGAATMRVFYSDPT
jgi:hypothetical protein